MTGLSFAMPAAAAPLRRRWLLSTDSAQRRGLKILLLRMQFYVVIWLLIALIVHWGFAPAHEARLVVAYAASFQALSYVALRSGWAPAQVEPRFTFIQVLLGLSALVLGYWLLPFTRGSAVQIMFVLVAFDMHRLTARQLNVASAA